MNLQHPAGAVRANSCWQICPKSHGQVNLSIRECAFEEFLHVFFSFLIIFNPPIVATVAAVRSFVFQNFHRSQGAVL